MNANFRQRFYAAVFAAVVASAPIAAHAMGDDEFVGPFPSWANVKTVYGAKGDGVTDDTAALQNALNGLNSTNPTIYLPAGSYRITQTLTLAAQQYVNVIGQDPATTSIIWAGASGGTMLYLNGVAYSRFDRLTFNGSGLAGNLVDQSWDGATGNFDTGNEYADDVFENGVSGTSTGLQCGFLQNGCSETSVLRNKFQNLHAGVNLCNFNALDIFVWYSIFVNDDEGVSNDCGAGNFHVYNSVFQNSAVSDLVIGNTGLFNFRNNYSTGSNQFINAAGIGAPANITVQSNTILDTTLSTSIDIGNLGPVVLLDNTIRSASGSAAPVADISGGDAFSVGNTFTAGSTARPCSTSAPVHSTVHCHEISDHVVARSTVNPTMPTLPGTPPNNHRQIFEVTPGSTAAQIQQAISKAAASGTVKPVVHIQPGSYNIDTTLTVPANSDMQIIGDGAGSQLAWVSTTIGPVLRLQGPSKVTLRNFSVDGGGNTADGIEVDNADQAGSRVFMEQPLLSLSLTNLFVDHLDYTNVELHDFYHNYVPVGTSVKVIGGPSAAAGIWRGGVTNIFAGASAGNPLSYGISNGAHVGIRDIWYEEGAGPSRIANVTGTGTFTYTGSELFQAGTAPLAISLNNFQGKAALLNLNTNGNIRITGNGGTAQVLGLGLVGPSATFFSNTSSPAAATEFLNGMKTIPVPGGLSTSELREVPSTPNTSFLTATLNQLRTEQPTLLAPLASGVSDVRFYRVFVGSANTGIHLR